MGQSLSDTFKISKGIFKVSLFELEWPYQRYLWISIDEA